MTAICAKRTAGVDASRGPIGRRPTWSFERLEENAGRVPKEEFPISDVAGEHGVRGMPCLLPDLERRDAHPSRARREAGAQAVAGIPGGVEP
jgi:hypothetical protein